MGLTGFFLITFLIVHCGLNSMIFFNDGGQTFNHWAQFMGDNLLIRTMEIGLFLFLLLHVIQGIILWRQNASARPVKYVVNHPEANSKWYSRSMGLLGTILLLFFIIHWKQFWIPSRFTGVNPVIIDGKEMHNLYNLMQITFTEPWVVIVYVLACFSLAWHLMHGFQSAFRTIGVHNKRFLSIIQATGTGFAIIISLVFAMMPVSMYLGWVK